MAGRSASVREPVPVLIVDADPAQRRLLAAHLSSGTATGAFRPVVCETAADAEAMAASGTPHIVIADVESIGGPARLGAFAGNGRSLIATSARGSVGAAIEAMRAGAIDYLPKPVGARALVERLDAAVAAWTAAIAAPTPAAPQRPAAPARAEADFEGFVGQSGAMRAVYARIDRVAASRAPVFLTGESGAGKEVCAAAIHARGGADRPFVAINCSAIPRDLIESEMFGHVRGAFTGASDDRTGAAELAHGGTLFLDEICEMAPMLQAKLLRFIQTGIVRRVGSDRDRPVDVRFICATNRDPEAEVAAGRFRADLLYRLNVLPVALPPLRERSDDVPGLAQAFLRRFAAEEGRACPALAPEALALLGRYRWPGNVRQLQNVVRRLVVLHEEPVVTAAMVASVLAAASPAGEAPAAMEAPAARAIAPFHEQERRIIEEAIAAFDGNIGRAAAALQINPSTIYRKRQAWQAGGAG